MFEQEIYQISIWALPVILAITFHEAAHGWMAYRLGDDTAYRLGRVTFNPFRHIDPVGTVLLPLALFLRSEDHTSELQSLMRIPYGVFCLKKKNNTVCKRYNDESHQ